MIATAALATAKILLAAGVTPWVVRHIGKPRWITALLAGGGLAQLALGLTVRRATRIQSG